MRWIAAAALLATGTVALFSRVPDAVALPASSPSTSPAAAADSVLRVRGLIVVDANGVERIWIGAPLPPPMFAGRRFARQGDISGILLMDPDGTERSGYFTADVGGEVALTLDNIAEQAALFMANPSTGTHLTLWDADRNSVRLEVLNGASITARRQGTLVGTLPDTASKTSATSGRQQ